MSKIISINAGSSSLKWKFYLMPEELVIAEGLIEKIGCRDSSSIVRVNGHYETQTLISENHDVAVQKLLCSLLDLDIIESYDEITGVGHRVVAGGSVFTDSIVVGEQELKQIEYLGVLAPLHNPVSANGIRAFRLILPDVPNVAVFDTAFHSSMPEKAYHYPIPKKYSVENKIRKYGAHGISHEYVAQEATKFLRKPIQELRLITAHLGNGVSITAIDGGRSVDTSMGFTPLGGVMMGTRTGDIDPSIIPYLMLHTEDFKTPESINTVLNKQSGLFGVSGLSNDMRDILSEMEAGDCDCQLAYDIFIDRIVKCIGQYLAILKGVDAIIFTGGIGENSAKVRRDIVNSFIWVGANISPGKSDIDCISGLVSTENAKIKILVVPTDEELAIAREVERLKN